MGEPIIEVIQEHVGYYKMVQISHTYEELLELFPEDGNVVNPLVKRCQQYEVEIERLRTLCEGKYPVFCALCGTEITELRCD